MRMWSKVLILFDIVLNRYIYSADVTFCLDNVWFENLRDCFRNNPVWDLGLLSWNPCYINLVSETENKICFLTRSGISFRIWWMVGLLLGEWNKAGKKLWSFTSPNKSEGFSCPPTQKPITPSSKNRHSSEKPSAVIFLYFIIICCHSSYTSKVTYLKSYIFFRQ